jgi:alkanesulfonate monooxygenase SsuD/methylene tetrahydromethanopterin reductase-like flavin-dependent oxidoreductase (luciferase family)
MASTPSSTKDHLRRLRLAEEAGLDHLAVGDHVSFYVGLGFDGLLAASQVLAGSATLASNTGVYLLPLRHPVVVARQVADMTAMAPGRFVFGVGIGGEDPHELEICGVDPRTRGRRMNECMHIVRGLLTGKPVDFAGEFYTLDHALILPAPVDPVPLVVGGRSDAAIARAGALGDGWIGVWVSPNRYASAVEQMQASADASGRNVTRWTNALNVWCGVGTTHEEARPRVADAMQAMYQLPYERFEKWSPAGTPEDIASFLIPYVESGCSLFNLILQAGDDEEAVGAAGEIRRLMHDSSRGRLPATVR